MTEKKRPPAIVLFSGDEGKWRRSQSLSTALNRSKEVVVTWDRGKESIFYLDRGRTDVTSGIEITG